MISSGILIHNMRTKSKWFISFLSLLAFAIITCRYSFMSFYKTAKSFNLMLGSRITISFHEASNRANRNSTHYKNYEMPIPITEIKILLWSGSSNKRTEKKMFPNYGKSRLACPVKYTFVTDKQQVNFVDAVVVDARQPKVLPARKLDVPWILQYDEPPTVYKILQNETFMKLFNYSIGYRMDSDFPNPRIGEPSIVEPLGFHQKYDYISAIFSNCTKVRTDYVQELSKHTRIKSYGECLRNVEKNNIARKGEENYISKKIQVMKLHKFTLSLMKFDCKDFVDETLNHAWEAGSLPVFLGTDSFQSLLPNYLRTSFIHIAKFARPKDLARELEQLSVDKASYDKFMSWRSKRQETIDDSPLWKVWRPDYSPGCQIAMTVKQYRLTGSSNAYKTLDPITCEERSRSIWLGKKPKVKIVNDD